MKNVSVITLFPELIQNAVLWGVLGQAIKKNILSVATVNPRDFTSDVHKTVDDRPFGGGDGMVMLAEPLEKALQSISRAKSSKVIYMSPQGKVLTDKKARELASLEQIILVCGRYAGVDQRFINQHVDEELSIGDYVLSGGEFAALTVMDVCSRCVPGVLGHVDSSSADSFANGVLEAPSFTRPQIYGQQNAPEILTSGHHQKIADWQKFVSYLVTFQKRPDLLSGISFTLKEKKEFAQFLDSGIDLKILGLQNLEIGKVQDWLRGK